MNEKNYKLNHSPLSIERNPFPKNQTLRSYGVYISPISFTKCDRQLSVCDLSVHLYSLLKNDGTKILIIAI